MRGSDIWRWIVTAFFGPNGLRAGWGLFFFTLTAAALAALIPSMLPPLHRHGDISLEVAALSEGLLLLAVVVATAIMARIEGRSTWSYGLSEPRLLQMFLRGGFWALVLLSIPVAIVTAIGNLAVDGGSLHGAEIPIYATAWMATFVVIALAEEMLFRGYLLYTLARLAGFWPAAILLSIIFGLVHLANDGGVVFGAVAAGAAGLIFCLCLRLSGSLWWGIGFHAVWDWAQAFLYGTPVSGTVIRERLLTSRAAGNSVWSGGTGGLEASVLAVPMLLMTVAIAMLTLRRPASHAPDPKPWTAVACQTSSPAEQRASPARWG